MNDLRRCACAQRKPIPHAVRDNKSAVLIAINARPIPEQRRTESHILGEHQLSSVSGSREYRSVGTAAVGRATGVDPAALRRSLPAMESPAERRVELPQDEVAAALEAVAGAIDAELKAG